MPFDPNDPVWRDAIETERGLNRYYMRRECRYYVLWGCLPVLIAFIACSGALTWVFSYAADR